MKSSRSIRIFTGISLATLAISAISSLAFTTVTASINKIDAFAGIEKRPEKISSAVNYLLVGSDTREGLSKAELKELRVGSVATAAGLNLAIKSSSHEIICRIDGHSEIESDYIKTAVLIMQETGAVNVGGLMHANSEFGLQRTIAQAMRSKLGVGPSKFHTGGKAGAADTVYLGVFKKSAIIAAGGFDERYIRAQDWELNHRMRKQGGLIWFDPRLIVTYRPRNSFSKLAKQYFQYGRWRRVIARQHPQTVNFRYLAPPIAVVITLISIVGGLFMNPIFILPTLTYLTLLLIGGFVVGRKLIDRLLMPFVLATMHFSWGVGFLTSPKKLFKN